MLMSRTALLLKLHLQESSHRLWDPYNSAGKCCSNYKTHPGSHSQFTAPAGLGFTSVWGVKQDFLHSYICAASGFPGW